RVVLLESGVRRPERAELDALKHVFQDARVHVPAAHDGGHELLAETPVDDREEHLLAALAELISDFGVAAVPRPGMGKEARRLEPCDDALESVALPLLGLRR